MSIRRSLVVLVACALSSALLSAPVAAQVDPERAKAYFAEAERLCARDAGELWGLSLYGPMVFADAATKTVATNEPAPDAPRPPALGFANAALVWGDARWSTFVWQMLPADEHARGRMMVHELFHRVPFELGLMTRDGDNAHLDTLDGRYWLQLEWRALAKALGASGAERAAAVRDALAFRSIRHQSFPGAAENERLEEIREGLAQYTGTVVANASAALAVADAIEQLAQAPASPTLVRNFAYPSGAAYGLLLDAWSPGWTRAIDADTDLVELLAAAAQLAPADDAAAAALRYGGAELRRAEEQRDLEQKARVAELRRLFVDGPVLVLPSAPGAFTTLGVTPIPGAGTVFPGVRVSAEWGRLEASNALRSTDNKWIALPAPASAEGASLHGDGWTLELAPGWSARPGPRAGDFEVVREDG